MTYIENIFLCMVSPLLVAALCMGRRQLRFFLFCIAGMGVCLLSAYINTFLAAVCQADALAATAEAMVSVLRRSRFSRSILAMRRFVSATRSS